MVEKNYIHSSAFVHPCAIIGENNTIMEGAIIRAGVVIGNNNYIGPYCIIGDDAEKVGWFDKPGRVIIGDNNRFTKQCTIDAGTERETYIGHHNLFLKNAHIGHDARILSFCIFSCNVCIGGFTQVEPENNFGLGAVVHQRLHILPGCMFGMNTTVTKKTPITAFTKYVGSPARAIGENPRRERSN